MPRPSRTLFPLMLLCACTVLPASAASLGGLGADEASGGAAAVASCDSEFGVSYATQGGDITAVTITGLADPACEGASLTVNTLSSGGTSIAGAGPAAVAADGDTADNSITLSLSPQPNAEQVDATAVLISGP